MEESCRRDACAPREGETTGVVPLHRAKRRASLCHGVRDLRWHLQSGVVC